MTVQYLFSLFYYCSKEKFERIPSQLTMGTKNLLVKWQCNISLHCSTLPSLNSVCPPHFLILSSAIEASLFQLVL